MLLVPPAVMTLTPRAPRAASLAIAKLAMRDVELSTLTPLTVTPVPLTRTVVAPAPRANWLPVSVTGTTVPSTPVSWEIIDKAGAGTATEKVTGLLSVRPVLTTTV